jgi:hypothetical protein
MLYNGTIYPISKSLIDEAKEAENSSAIKTSTLPSFDINYLEKEWEPKKEINFSHYKFYGAAMIEEIAKVNKVSKNDIYLKKVRAPNKGQFGSLSFFGFQNINYFEGNGNTCMTSRYLAKQNDYEMYIKREIYSTKIVTIFSCNWVKDFNDDGLSFSECQNIKRSFFENENIVLVAGYTSLEEGKWQLDVYESTSGKKVRSSSGTVGEGWRIAWIYLDNHLLQPGVYVYSFVVIINTKQNISKSEKFEILRSLN